MKLRHLNRLGKSLALTLLFSLGQGMYAAADGDNFAIFPPASGGGALEHYRVMGENGELASQEFLQFDPSEAYNEIPSIELTSKAGEEVMLKGIVPTVLSPERNYTLRVLVKFSELVPVKEEQKTRLRSMFVVYLRSSGKIYHATRIGPSAESGGWVKVYIPFSSSEADFDKVTVDFRMLALQGSIWICDPRIVEVPENFPKERFFELPSGERVSPVVLHYHHQP